MVATVNHFGDATSMDIVGMLWVVYYVGICRVMYQQSVMHSQQGGEDHTYWRWSHRLGSLHAELVVVPSHPGRDIMGE